MSQALAQKVEAETEPQVEKQIVGTCSPGVFLARDEQGKEVEVDVVWRPVGKKRVLHVLFDGVSGADDQFVPVAESGLNFLARISGIRPPHFEMMD